MLRISLRQVLILVAAIAMTIVSLKYASPWWQSVVTLIGLLTFFAAMIVGIFDRGPRQTFAIGMVLVMFGYGVLIMNGRRSFSATGGTASYEELHGNGYLPTTDILHELYRLIFGPEEARLGRAQNAPSESTFVQTGYAWWALLLGYLGGSLAQEVDRSRKKREAGVP